MLENFGNKLIFPAPDPSYTAKSYKRHLCWIPWSSVISPGKAAEREDGIPCLWFPAPKAATVLLFFHANAEDLGMCFQLLKHMRDQFKVNVMSVEYPGYGLLQDLDPSEDGVYEVALTALRFLVDEVGVRYSQIILCGRSLGSGPAVYVASRYPVGGLVLVSPFSSIKGAVQSIVGQAFAWSITERFPNLKVISNVSCPVLFIHGESDSLIPAEHSLRLFKRCRARKLLVMPPKMEHNSNLFGDASFLAVPAIHFFGFPGYYTSTPPRLPAYLFENPERRARLREQMREESTMSQPWLCSCLAKSDPHHLDVTFCRQEHSVEDITIRFSEAPTESNGNGPNSMGDASSKTNANNKKAYSDFAQADPGNVPREASELQRETSEVPPSHVADFPPRSSSLPPKEETGRSASDEIDQLPGDEVGEEPSPSVEYTVTM